MEKAKVKTEKCPGCGAEIVLKLAGDSQPTAYDANGKEHICADETLAEFERRSIGQAIIGATITGFGVRNRKMTLALSGNRLLSVFAGGKKLRIWVVGPEGILDDESEHG